MTGRLQGKSVLVTAAGQGIGRAIAERFAGEGARVTATDLDPSKLDGLDAAGVAGRRSLDVTSSEAIAALAEELGAIDALVNCAGYVHHGTVLECAEAAWDFSFDLNVKSMYRTMRAFLPAMLEKGGGSIINIASIASSIKGVPFRVAYAASKAAVIGLTRAVAADYVTRGIRCNAIAPGTVQSPSLEDRIAAFDDPVAARKAFIARQPMGRLGTPAEIASIAVYLASEESAFTTGQVMIIDGGMTI